MKKMIPKELKDGSEYVMHVTYVQSRSMWVVNTYDLWLSVVSVFHGTQRIRYATIVASTKHAY